MEIGIQHFFLSLARYSGARKKKIASLKDADGTWIHDKENVKFLIANYFSTLFTKDNDIGVSNLPMDVFPKIPTREWHFLSLPFTHKLFLESDI